MEGHILYFSKEERTVSEIAEKMENYWKGLDIPETSYARLDDLDDQRFMNRFEYRQMKCRKENVLDTLYKALQSAEESQEPDEEFIDYLKVEIELSKLAMKNDFIGWLTYEGHYVVRDKTIYVKKNFIDGFYDSLYEETSMLLTDKHGNKVVSGICKDIIFDDFFKTEVAMYFEDTGACKQKARFYTDSRLVGKENTIGTAVTKFRDVKIADDGIYIWDDKIPLDYYCRIVEYSEREIYTNI